MPTWKESVTFTDSRGQHARTTFYVTAATAVFAETKAGSVVAALTPVTSAVLYTARGPYNVENAFAYGTNPAGDQLTTAEDKLILAAVLSDNRPWRMSVPAPQPTTFLADDETPDFANADLAALLDELTTADGNGATVSGKGGEAVSSVYGGLRRRSRTQRRFTLRTRNPQLTGPGL